MIRCCALLARPGISLSAGLLLCFIASFSAFAQTGGYTPPQQPYDEGPRSIRPPQGNSTYNSPGYGAPYTPAPSTGPAPQAYSSGPPPQSGTYSNSEIVDTGHRFFGDVSEGLAKVVEHAFKRNGSPNGYILGEEGSGAVIAGLRYGEGMLYTKMYPPQKVYWQGPSLGYDFGANGSKVMTLIYNLGYTSQLYERFAGIDGSAYLIGGVGITFQQHDDVILAPIRAGLGLRLGANVGYLKYTTSPTWNPF
jgi:hypothetical protein